MCLGGFLWPLQLVAGRRPSHIQATRSNGKFTSRHLPSAPQPSLRVIPCRLRSGSFHMPTRSPKRARGTRKRRRKSFQRLELGSHVYVIITDNLYDARRAATRSVWDRIGSSCIGNETYHNTASASTFWASSWP